MCNHHFPEGRREDLLQAPDGVEPERGEQFRDGGPRESVWPSFDAHERCLLLCCGCSRAALSCVGAGRPLHFVPLRKPLTQCDQQSRQGSRSWAILFGNVGLRRAADPRGGGLRSMVCSPRSARILSLVGCRWIAGWDWCRLNRCGLFHCL